MEPVKLILFKLHLLTLFIHTLFCSKTAITCCWSPFQPLFFTSRTSLLNLYVFKMTGKIVIYQDDNFGGASREVTGDVSDLTSIGFNDRISSIKVLGSVWIGYEHANHQGRQYILEEGDYANAGEWQGSNDQLSSLKKLNPDIGETPQITLYQHDNYGGNAVNFSYGIDNLGYYHFNDEASSLKVKNGIWILYQDNGYKGKQNIVTEGWYPSAGNWRGGNDQISSLRPIKEPFHPTEILSMEFDIAAGLISATPYSLVNLSQRNDSSVDQQASWGAKRSYTTTKTYEWHWQNTTAVSVETTFSTGVPFIADGEIKMSVSNSFSVGENKGSSNTQSDEWSFNLPATVKAQTMLRVQVNIQQGKIDVPFTAMLRKGNRTWKEIGTFKGTQSFNLQVDYTETPL